MRCYGHNDQEILHPPEAPEHKPAREYPVSEEPEDSPVRPERKPALKEFLEAIDRA